MPQGVEHFQEICVPNDYRPVRIPLMPQGVEHPGWARLRTCYAREDSIDAARR